MTLLCLTGDVSTHANEIRNQKIKHFKCNIYLLLYTYILFVNAKHQLHIYFMSLKSQQGFK